jgi:hypothetical protein
LVRNDFLITVIQVSPDQGIAGFGASTHFKGPEEIKEIGEQGTFL